MGHILNYLLLLSPSLLPHFLLYYYLFLFYFLLLPKKPKTNSTLNPSLLQVTAASVCLKLRQAVAPRVLNLLQSLFVLSTPPWLDRRPFSRRAGLRLRAGKGSSYRNKGNHSIGGLVSNTVDMKVINFDVESFGEKFRLSECCRPSVRSTGPAWRGSGRA